MVRNETDLRWFQPFYVISFRSKVDYSLFLNMSGRPKRTIKPVQRFHPGEGEKFEDDYDDEELPSEEASKRYKGDFDGLDDEEEDLEEENEYEVGDGFVVDDEEVDESAPVSEEEEYKEEEDDEDEEEYEADVVNPDAALDENVDEVEEEEGAEHEESSEDEE